MPPTKTIDIAATFSRANLLHQRGQLKEAAPLYRRILSADPAHFDASHMLGVLRVQEGRFVEAAEAMAYALKGAPHNPQVLCNYGNVLKALGHLDEALLSYEASLSLYDTASVTWFNRGLVLVDLRRLADAVASYDRALAITPDYREALLSRAAALCEMGLFHDALSSADAAIRIGPDLPEAFHMRGLALWRLKRFDAALDSYNLALAIAPRSAGILNNRGMALLAMERHEDALTSFDAAIELQPNYIEALNNRGIALASLHRHEEALQSFDKALGFKPDTIDALSGKGGVLTALGRFDDALVSYAAVLEVAPANSDALYNSAVTLSHLNRFGEALARFEAALSSKPNQPYALSGAANAALNLCDWARTGPMGDRLAADVVAQKSAVSPFTLLGYSDDASLQLRCAMTYLKDMGAQCRDVGRPVIAHRHDRMRIAYVSSDFGDHPVSYSLVELLERHDRSDFEIHGVCLGGDDGSLMRKRLVEAFDHFHDARLMQDRDIADLMRQREIDIAVDLNGHTQNARPQIFAFRAAPVQVNYLGYPGTTGSACMDYILADPVVAPLGEQHAYSEAIVHLPGSYFVSDARRTIPAPTARRDAGLPDAGVVFCCFNQNWKITEPLFDIWMRLLQKTPDSVLWLRDCAEAARSNLRNEAGSRGIGADRLVFAGSVDFERHMARLQLADIFLDTLPYNAHATASDALWAGVPVVTCRGKAFAGRVASSLLLAMEMPELVTATLDEYENLALRLARDPAALAALREKLARNKVTAPLFDTDRSRRNIEAAYRQMLKRAALGEQPMAFTITGEMAGPVS